MIQHPHQQEDVVARDLISTVQVRMVGPDREIFEEELNLVRFGRKTVLRSNATKNQTIGREEGKRPQEEIKKPQLAVDIASDRRSSA